MAICHPFLVLGLMLCSTFCWSQFDFESPQIKSAYRAVLHLQTTSAQQQLTKLKGSSSDSLNGIIPLLENYLDIITLLTTEDKELYKTLKSNERKRIQEIQQLTPDSPYYLYTQADIKLQWAFVELIFEDYLAGFVDLKQANDLIDKNIEKYPTFQPNNKVKGLIDLLTEATPQEANFALFAAGLKRNQDGRQKLLRTAVFQPFLSSEINIYISFVDAYIKHQPLLGLERIEETYRLAPQNLFAQFTYINILSQLGRYPEILELLKQNALYLQPDYLYIPYLDYIRGESLLYGQHLEQAVQTFKSFVEKTNGQTFIRTSYLKMAQVYAIKHQPDSVKTTIKHLLEAPKSNLYLDEYATFVAQNKLELNPELTQARIWYDGGQYNQALELLLTHAPFKKSSLESERHYRIARCASKLGNWKQAIEHYSACIAASTLKTKTYYAAQSCLQLGYHYQGNNNRLEAQKYYELAKRYKKHFYSSSVTQKANTKLTELAKR